MPETIIWSQPITFTETAKGAPGPAGAPGPQYGLRCDTSSIVRELDTKEVSNISPSKISFIALKNTGDTDTPTQETLSCGSEYEIKLYKSTFTNQNGGESKIIEEGLTYFNQTTTSQTQLEIYDKIQLDLSSYTRKGANSNASAIKAQLIYKTIIDEEVQTIVLVELSIPITLSNNLLDIAQIDGTTVKISGGKVFADSIVAGAVTGEKIAAESITAAHFVGSRLDSLSPTPEFLESDTGKDFYTEKGAQIRLDGAGSIHFKNFYISNNGNVGIRGHVEAQSGAILGKLTIGESENIFLDGTSVGEGEGTRNIFQVLDYFSVRSDGYVVLKSGQIAGWDITENTISAQNGSVGMSSIPVNNENSNPLRFYAGRPEGQNTYNFRVYNNGDLYAQQANLTSGNIYGNFYVGQEGQTQGITINGSSGNISTSQFASGAYGWRIEQNGNAEFNNATIRGKLTSVVFEKQTVSAINGDLYIAPSYILKKDLQTGISLENDTITLSFVRPGDFPKDWENGIQVLLSFSQGDNIYNNVSGQLDQIMEDGITEITLTFPQIASAPYIDGSTNISSDVQIITVGTTTKDGLNYKYIYLTANANDSPFIDVQDYKSGDSNPLPKVRMGCLTGITDTVNGFGDLQGYGLYCSNAYLTGELNLPQAGITNQAQVGFNGEKYIDGSNTDKLIRFWAGGASKPANDNKDIAPFIVTQDGSLYASKGVFKGQIIATDSVFSGTIQAAGIIIGRGGNYYNPAPSPEHFFVGYELDSTKTERDFDDYVLDISSKGLSIWEGGFRIYSDALSGWETTKNEAGADPLYGYTSTNKSPFPYVSANDAGRLLTRELHNITISKDGANYNANSLLLTDGLLYFNSYSSSKMDGFLEYETDSCESARQSGIYIGLKEGILSLASPTGIKANSQDSNIDMIANLVKISDKTGFTAKMSLAGAIIQQVYDDETKNPIGLNFLFE